ncbi:hypothetical protein HOT57_gp88 [Pseudomonas phage phCDa]|uniref:Lysozyme n=1 Tax=Pseudomonas phage phCDa TaxID=2268587 RepID=A0A2Z5HAK0_9CAUD|nr:hypothetical protein HOT57_gp88 [Pseudomonas phage phCDa]AXC36532.1 hypothetical protein phCDa_88 [Pseudomonas phage phCDa]
MNLNDVVNKVFKQAFRLFPAHYDSLAVRLLMLTIGLQESRFTSRRQLISKVVDGKRVLVPEGPAIGFWQFEKGNAVSKGGVWGVLNHYRVGPLAQEICRGQGLKADAETVWLAMETNDVLAAAFARLLLLSDAKALPKIGDVDGAWECYAIRTWRPGKPHRETWDAFYAQARKELGV